MYTFDSRVRYSETGEEGLLSLPAIVDYFQDVSTFQSEDLGIGIDFLKEKDLLPELRALPANRNNARRQCDNFLPSILHSQEYIPVLYP